MTRPSIVPMLPVTSRQLLPIARLTAESPRASDPPNLSSPPDYGYFGPNLVIYALFQVLPICGKSSVDLV